MGGLNLGDDTGRLKGWFYIVLGRYLYNKVFRDLLPFVLELHIFVVGVFLHGQDPKP